MATDPSTFQHTSGSTDSVWTFKQPYDKIPTFPALDKELSTHVCVIGSGISGTHVAFELVRRGHNVVMLEARDAVSGETGRTSGHLTSDLDDGYIDIAKKHGQEGASRAAQAHSWAIARVGEIAEELGIDCEYRRVKAYTVSQHKVGTKEHDQDLKELREEAELQRKLGLQAAFDEHLTVPGWKGKPDQRGGMVVDQQAAFHPTRYVAGILAWLKKQPNFQGYTHSRVSSIQEQGVELLGMGHKRVKIETEDGHIVHAEHAVEATNVPLQKLSIIAELSPERSYCIAIRVPRGSVEDCFIYDTADEYKYVRLTACDEKDDYLIVGGCDHAVGQEPASAERFQELETWTRERFPQAGTVDYRWSGQIQEPVDFVAYIGKNPGQERVYIVTGDSGDGLTHGVLAGRLIADEIDGKQNDWAGLYSPKRLGSIMKTLPSMIKHDVQINLQYARLLSTDIEDIGQLGLGCGALLNTKTSKPLAVYKDENGKVHKYSALCPHMQGVVTWNETEKSFDCPVHGSRFSKEGICVQGPAKSNLKPADESGKGAQEEVAGAGM